MFITPNHGQQDLYCSVTCRNKVQRRIRRAREVKAPGTFTFTDVMRIYMKQGMVCAYCKQHVAGLPEGEHVVPLSRGGRNDTTNLLAACHACNGDKGDMSPDEWAISRAARGLTPRHTDLTTYSHLVVSAPVGQPMRLAQRAA
jgi:5-methylcytosine-specific restriction endonuclease McrA